MKYFPIFLRLDHQRVVIAGDDDAVLAKVRLLLKTTAELHVHIEWPQPDLQTLAKRGRITLHRLAPRRADLEVAKLVYLAYDNIAIARSIRALCQSLGVLCNTVDNAGASDFISGAIVDRDPVVIAIGSEGSAPVLVRQIKCEIERLLGATTGAVARLAARLRPAVRSRLDKSAQLQFWTRFFAGDADSAIAVGGSDSARRRFQTELRVPTAVPVHSRVVTIIGAGPGNPDLLTVAACRELGRADVVLHDRLVGDGILDLVRRDARRIEVGKVAGGHSWKQDEINRELLRHASTGERVVRLKSGDPMIFGRADEELDALEAACIQAIVIPGITAAGAAAASIRSSLTRRGRNVAFTILTAQSAAGYTEHDWRQLARPGATSAIYMGVRAAKFVQGRLLLHGAQETTAVTIVENVSLENERIITTSLGSLADALATHGISGPSIIFIGLSARDPVRAAMRGVDAPALVTA